MLASQAEARAHLLPGPRPDGYHACCPLSPVDHLEGYKVLTGVGMLVQQPPQVRHQQPPGGAAGVRPWRVAAEACSAAAPDVCGHREAPIPRYFFYIGLLGMEL